MIVASRIKSRRSDTGDHDFVRRKASALLLGRPDSAPNGVKVFHGAERHFEHDATDRCWRNARQSALNGKQLKKLGTGTTLNGQEFNRRIGTSHLTVNGEQCD
jgi:hypothetical protein